MGKIAAHRRRLDVDNVGRHQARHFAAAFVATLAAKSLFFALIAHQCFKCGCRVAAASQRALAQNTRTILALSLAATRRCFSAIDIFARFFLAKVLTKRLDGLLTRFFDAHRVASVILARVFVVERLDCLKNLIGRHVQMAHARWPIQPINQTDGAAIRFVHVCTAARHVGATAHFFGNFGKLAKLSAPALLKAGFAQLGKRAKRRLRCGIVLVMRKLQCMKAHCLVARVERHAALGAKMMQAVVCCAANGRHILRIVVRCKVRRPKLQTAPKIERWHATADECVARKEFDAHGWRKNRCRKRIAAKV